MRDFEQLLGLLFVAPVLLDAAYDASLRDLRDEDPVGREVSAARERALQAGLATFAHDASPAADAMREEFTAHLTHAAPDGDADGATQSAHGGLHRKALEAARHAVLAMRANDEIGDDAFHRIEEELDWMEMAAPATGRDGA